VLTQARIADPGYSFRSSSITSEGVHAFPLQIFTTLPSGPMSAVARPWEIVPPSGCTRTAKLCVSLSISAGSPVANELDSVNQTDSSAAVALFSDQNE
jgi:hypothetical protein